MTKQRKLITILVLVIAAFSALAYVYLRPNVDIPLSDLVSQDKEAPEALSGIPPGFLPLVSEAYGFGVLYPKKYYVSATELDASTTPHLAVVVVLDTQEHRDIFEGRITPPRDGPNGITINVYPNTTKLTAGEFAAQDMNWGVSDKKLATTSIAGEEGVVFRWSGLYEGASLVLAREKFVYVFAVSWQSKDDPILADFDAMLQTLRFLDAK